MKISTKGRYALRLMVSLAEYGNEKHVPLKEIAAQQDISVKYLEQIVIQLNAAGYLRSCRGPQGGYKLSRSPKDYSVGSILRITEGSMAPIHCLEDKDNQCSRYGECSTIEFWEGLHHAINQYIDSFTLQDLLDRQTEKGKAIC